MPPAQAWRQQARSQARPSDRLPGLQLPMLWSPFCFLPATRPAATAAERPRLERILRGVPIVVAWYFVLSDHYRVAFADITPGDLGDASVGDSNTNEPDIELFIRTQHIDELALATLLTAAGSRAGCSALAYTSGVRPAGVWP